MLQVKAKQIASPHILPTNAVSADTTSRKSSFPHCHSHPPRLVSFIHFRLPKVRILLERLNTSKATGPDTISPRVLKECSKELATPLSKLFALYFHTGVQPDMWKTASVVPIHKRSSKAAVCNYRPVSLLSVMSKVMETIINKQLMNHLDRHELLITRQFEFRKGLGTADLLTALHHVWATTVSCRGFVRVLAIDCRRLRLSIRCRPSSQSCISRHRWSATYLVIELSIRPASAGSRRWSAYSYISYSCRRATRQHSGPYTIFTVHQRC